MILFLPVSTYRAEYRIGRDRPFGALEQLLVNTIRDKGRQRIADLKDTFGLHERLILEAVVTLFYAGYVGLVGSDLVYIGAGPNAPDPAEPLQPTSSETKTAYVIQERITGQLLRRDAVRFARIAGLRKEGKLQQGFVIPAADLPPTVDPGQVVPLLEIPSNGYLSDVGAVLNDRAGQDVIVVTVDLSRNRVHNLPPEWQAGISDILLLWARHFRRTTPKDDPRLHGAAWSGDPSYAATGVKKKLIPEFHLAATSVSILGGEAEHEAAFRDLIDGAASHLLLLVPDICDEKLALLDRPLRAAVQRGVNIEVLWGREPDARDTASHKAAFERLKRIEYDTRVNVGVARLLVGRKPSGVRATVIAADVGTTPTVQVGNYRYFGQTTTESQCLSVSLAEGGVVALLYRVLADICADDDVLIAGASTTWLRYQAAEIDKATVTGRPQQQSVEEDEAEGGEDDEYSSRLPPTSLSEVPAEGGTAAIRVRILIDRQHEESLREAVDAATRRLDIGTPRLSAQGLHSRMAKPRIALERGGPTVTVYYSQLALETEGMGPLTEAIEKPGGRLACVPALQTGFVIQDSDRLVLGSHAWLDAYPAQVRPYGVDIGVELVGPGLGDCGRRKIGIETD